MKIILACIGIILFFISCVSVDYTQKRQVKFTSNYSVNGFFLFAPDVLESEGFTILSSDEQKGVLRASKSVKNEFTIDIIITIDDDSRKVNMLIINRIQKAEGELTEYYTLEYFNPSYEEYFYNAASTIRSNSTKIAFPN